MTDFTGNVLLTLVVPPAVEDTVIDLLLAHPELVRGFTTTQGEGHGAAVELLSPAEQVRGSARRTTVRLVVPPETAQALVDLLRQNLAGAHLFYWITPILDAGRIE
ncbi:hypothetical protein DLREEDagrD3_20740 [Denitratisoma sp. agr-D3]